MRPGGLQMIRPRSDYSGRGCFLYFPALKVFRKIFDFPLLRGKIGLRCVMVGMGKPILSLFPTSYRRAPAAAIVRGTLYAAGRTSPTIRAGGSRPPRGDMVVQHILNMP